MVVDPVRPNRRDDNTFENTPRVSWRRRRASISAGPTGKLNLRATNLTDFARLAEGIDDEIWMYHLRRGDYSRWFTEMIGDEQLAEESARIERDEQRDAADSREAIEAAIRERYTAPE